MKSVQLALRVIAVLSFIVAIVWMIVAPGFEPLSVALGGITSLITSFVIDRSQENTESLDQHNRRVMLNHVENFWVKGILEKSLHGAALLELGIKEDPSAISYPWAIKRESTKETLPTGKSMLDIFNEIGAGRSLLILGTPGSGKTTVLIELARQLIERARNDETEPIPVVFNLASWTEKQSLADWLASQLNIVYYVPKKTTPKWVSENKMLLLLDGLDEVKQESRKKCVEAINQFRNEHGLTSFVVCSRIEEYTAINTKLSLEGAIELQPLTTKQVNDYFDKLGKSLAGVKQLLKKDKTLRELAATPLMLSIMTLAYKDKKPEELPALNNIEEQRRHLFDAYINRMFERTTRMSNSPFTKEQTLHYLSWLARKMVQHNIVTYQIEAMQTSWLEGDDQRHLHKLYVWLSVGLSVGLNAGLFTGLVVRLVGGLSYTGVIMGLVAGLVAGLIAWWADADKISMVDRIRWSWKKARRQLIVWLIAGLSGGLMVWLIDGLIGGLIFGLMIGLSSLLGFGLSSEQIEETTHPSQHLKQTLYNIVWVVISFVLIVGLSAGLIIGLSLGLSAGLSLGLSAGLSAGLSIGLISVLDYGVLALIGHYMLRFNLIKNDFMPRYLLPFLEYAINLIFLRRVGGGYIFVHRLLMEHFAEMGVEKQ